MFGIFIFGFVFNMPFIFIQINFIIKVSIAIYLMYKFNNFREKITFTTLDKKICFSAGFYIFIFSFADVINSYFIYSFPGLTAVTPFLSISSSNILLSIVLCECENTKIVFNGSSCTNGTV